MPLPVRCFNRNPVFDVLIFCRLPDLARDGSGLGRTRELRHSERTLRGFPRYASGCASLQNISDIHGGASYGNAPRCRTHRAVCEKCRSKDGVSGSNRFESRADLHLAPESLLGYLKYSQRIPLG